ncbi:phosphatidate cytidylyltransferase [Anaerorhabdus furcosa]|uniref:Phosphatidate cytidylyltransferase n=1 Tax=Anaerorhabdus furcosa TaxID=118967 RepID=A0A1T4P1H1_9FIRM|nr:phosphatidate cytidylyltransferase [Anaerorhabdus furcosa]SJZ85242.1 phosphatidate cytidylyltransferase [Anaerorhabdus furcosa]
MKQRLVTGLIIALIAVPPLVLGGFPLLLLVFAVSGLASYEILAVRGGKISWGLVSFLFASTLVMYLVPIDFYIPAIIAFLIVLFVIHIFTKEISIEDLSYVFVMTMILTLAVKGIIHIYNYGGLVMIYVALACFGCDTGAYFFGVFFGKHKLIERISPKKTWEGAIGGWLTGAVASYAFAMIFIPNMFDPSVILFSSLTLPIVAQIGDLSFSAVKRQYHVKDFGSIFPGHGGVLDRVDSLLFCLMYFHAILLFIEVVVII